MQPSDQWYAIVASDGIWEAWQFGQPGMPNSNMGRSPFCPKEFIEGEDCCNMTSKKLRLKGTRETATWMTWMTWNSETFSNFQLS